MDEIWKAKIECELSRALSARQCGNEGMARVCARRAAGWAVQAHLREQGVDMKTPSALDHLEYLRTQDETAPEARSLLEHLVQRVQKDSADREAYWPLEADLIADARRLVEILLGDEGRVRESG